MRIVFYNEKSQIEPRSLRLNMKLLPRSFKFNLRLLSAMLS